jgi:UDP-2,3-diacylglucosamine hydrolase
MLPNNNILTTDIIELKQGEKIYFASDFHLGIPDHPSSLKRERLLVAWLESIRKDAKEIYLMGDLFDFWFEYKTVVPKGFVRLFGKLAEITDSGIDVHLFKGNHDIWAFDYFAKELNIKIHRECQIKVFNGQHLFLAHGDGLGPGDNGYKILKSLFEFKPNQWLFKWIHPDIGTRLALYFSRRSRYANILQEADWESNGGRSISDERLYQFSNDMLLKNSSINYFVFGHQHKPIDKRISSGCRMIILGDWLYNFTYAVFDGEDMSLRYFKKDEADTTL